MKKYTLILTGPEFNHIVTLLYHNEDDGIYNGPKDQYWKRHRRILRKCADADREAGG